MKTCPYCGKEYPDDTGLCTFDQTSLIAVISATDRPATFQPNRPDEGLRLAGILLIVVAVPLADFLVPFACGFFDLAPGFSLVLLPVILLGPPGAGVLVAALLRNVSWFARITVGVLTCVVLFVLVWVSPPSATAWRLGFATNFQLTKQPVEMQQWAVGVLDRYEKGELETTTNVERWAVGPRKLYDDEIPLFIENLWPKEPSIGIAAMASSGSGLNLIGTNGIDITALGANTFHQTLCVAFSWKHTCILVGRPDFRPALESWRFYEIEPGIYLFQGDQSGPPR